MEIMRKKQRSKARRLAHTLWKKFSDKPLIKAIGNVLAIEQMSSEEKLYFISESLRRRLELAEAVCHAADSLKTEIESLENKNKDLCCFNTWFIMCDALEVRRQAREGK